MSGVIREGIGLDQAEDKACVAMEKTCHRDTDTGQHTHGPLVPVQGLGADIHGPHGEHRSTASRSVSTALRSVSAQVQNAFNDEPAVDEPYFGSHDHAVGGEDDAEGLNCPGEVGGHQENSIPERLLQMEQQGHHGHGKQGQGKYQEKRAISFNCLTPKTWYRDERTKAPATRPVMNGYMTIWMDQ